MIIPTIKAQLEQTLLESGKGDGFDVRLDQLSEKSSQPLTPESRQQIRALVENYVRSSVWMLEEVDTVTVQLGIAPVATPLLHIAAGYFLNHQDLIPDHQGLMGLVDDAYLAVRFMASLSALYAAETGVGLIDVSLDNSSPIIRSLIESTIAGQLDRMIEQGLSQALQSANLAQLQPVRYRSAAEWNSWVASENSINAEAEILAITGGMF